jgi:hypothetical protein
VAPSLRLDLRLSLRCGPDAARPSPSGAVRRSARHSRHMQGILDTTADRAVSSIVGCTLNRNVFRESTMAPRPPSPHGQHEPVLYSSAFGAMGSRAGGARYATVSAPGGRSLRPLPAASLVLASGGGGGAFGSPRAGGTFPSASGGPRDPPGFTRLTDGASLGFALAVGFGFAACSSAAAEAGFAGAADAAAGPPAVPTSLPLPARGAMTERTSWLGPSCNRGAAEL